MFTPSVRGDILALKEKRGAHNSAILICYLQPTGFEVRRQASSHSGCAQIVLLYNTLVTKIY